jgi:hypothetical protein
MKQASRLQLQEWQSLFSYSVKSKVDLTRTITIVEVLTFWICSGTSRGIFRLNFLLRARRDCHTRNKGEKNDADELFHRGCLGFVFWVEIFLLVVTECFFCSKINATNIAAGDKPMTCNVLAKITCVP